MAFGLGGCGCGHTEGCDWCKYCNKVGKKLSSIELEFVKKREGENRKKKLLSYLSYLIGFLKPINLKKGKK